MKGGKTGTPRQTDRLHQNFTAPNCDDYAVHVHLFLSINVVMYKSFDLKVEHTQTTPILQCLIFDLGGGGPGETFSICFSVCLLLSLLPAGYTMTDRQ